MLKEIGNFVSFVLLVVLMLVVSRAYSQEREYTLRLNQSDLQLLDDVLNDAPVPRRRTQPFINKVLGQIAEQNKPSSPAASEAPKPDTGTPEAPK